MKKNILPVLYGVALISFTGYAALDTFVLSDSYQTGAGAVNMAMFEEEGSLAGTGKVVMAGETVQTLEDAKQVSPGSSDRDGTHTVARDTVDTTNGDSSDTVKGDNSSSRKKKRGSESTNSDNSGKGRGRSVRNESKTSGSIVSNSSRGSNSNSNNSNSNNSSNSSNSNNSNNSSSSSQSSSAILSTGADGIIGTFESEDAQVTVSQYTYEGSKVYVADIELSSVQYLKTAFAQGTYGKNITQTTSEMAEAANAVLAINGDNYGSREKGVVIRNGVVYRDTTGSDEILCIYRDGSMKIMNPGEYSAEELVAQGVWQALSFGPGLVENGTISVTEEDEVGRAKASNPRTAIGQIDDLHYVMVVSDGRTEESEGLSLYQLAAFMKDLGVKEAYNLDGGGSSTMVFNGTVINQPTSTGNSIKERKVNDIVYIG